MFDQPVTINPYFKKDFVFLEVVGSSSFCFLGGFNLVVNYVYVIYVIIILYVCYLCIICFQEQPL